MTTRQNNATPLAPLDRAFLWMERLGQPFHVGYVNVFAPPSGASPEFARELADRLRSVAPTWPFDRRLNRPFGGDWVEDDRFDIDRHLVRIAVPGPGGKEDLQQLVSELHAIPLDPARPLWRFYLIEGLRDGRIATYCKVHHALADGVAGTRLLLKSMSSEPDQILPPPWAIAAPVTRPRVRRPQPASRLAALLNGLGSALGALPTALLEARQTLREARRGNPYTVSGEQAPACLFNQPIGVAREFATQSLSLVRIKALCGAFNCSTNDIVLALCAAALSRYLVDLDALPDRPLIAMVPMSTRHDDSECGNRVVPLLVNLGTDLADPVERLRLICESAARSIQRQIGWSAAEAYGYTLATSARGLIQQLLGPTRGKLAFNVVISKLSGPRTPQYWQGCRLEGMVPASVVMDGLGLNITVATREAWIDFGLVACPQTVPRLKRLPGYLDSALDELEGKVSERRAVCRAAEERLAGDDATSAAGAGIPVLPLDLERYALARGAESWPPAEVPPWLLNGAAPLATDGRPAA